MTAAEYAEKPQPVAVAPKKVNKVWPANVSPRSILVLPRLPRHAAH